MDLPMTLVGAYTLWREWVAYYMKKYNFTHEQAMRYMVGEL